MNNFFNPMKWRLLLKVLPLTLVFGLVKIGVHLLHWEVWTFDSLIGALFGAVTFIIAFILSGTLNEYNASADMTVQLVNAIETIEDTNLLIAATNPDYNSKPLTKGLAQILQTTLEWLKEDKPLKNLEDSLFQLNYQFVELQRVAGFPVVNRVQQELSRMRILITRLQSNKSTEFLEAADALLDIFLVGAVIALLLIGSDLFNKNLMVSCFLFTLFSYLMFLIRDLDDPFEYDGKSCVDVDLSLLEATHKRLQQEIGG